MKKFVKTQEEFLNEAKANPFELTTLTDIDDTERKKMIAKNYPKNLAYKNMDFNKIYQNIIVPFAQKELSEPGFWDTDNKESYLGYLPGEDVFISGWDMANEEEIPENVVFILIDDNGNPKLSGKGWSIKGLYGKMYVRNGSYDILHNKFPDLTDIKSK